MKTVLIMSRGMRLAPMFKVMAAELARDHRVIVAINTVCADQETQFWQDFKEGIVIDFDRRIQQAMSNRDRWSASFISQIEAETGITLYKSTSNYQLYRRLQKSYLGQRAWDSFYDAEEDTVREYVGSYLVLTQIFEDFAPDIIFYEAIDLISTYVALALSYNRGIFALGYHAAPASDKKIVLFYGIHRQNLVLQELFNHPDLIDQEARQAARDLISRLNLEKMSPPWYVQSYKKSLGGPHYLNPQKIFQNLRHRKTWPDPLRYLRKLKNLAWLGAHSHKAIPEEPYLVFFLHHQPEASTCSVAPRWVDQNVIIEQLAINAPYGLKIVIKEHPRTYGARGKVYFGPLLEIPNVYMCHPTVSTFEVAKRSEAIFTIVGSIGLEGIIMGKRVAVLARPYYSIYPGVKKLHYPDEIFAALGDASWQPQNLEQEREDFTAAYLASQHDCGPVPPGQIWPIPEVGGSLMAQALHRTIGFIEAHNLKPVDFDPGIVA
ncbi:MAG: hypothetical protein D4R73_07345 [Deltaproteobacteria bacterium]|nr:MAG: hypothetical protein D4R73_07345 [Deltaproteobacteria bacterium]